MTRPEHVENLVVGSGFGGAVAAYRLADAGRPVRVLERGGALPPGAFPRAPHLLRRNFWDPSAGLYGMWNVWFFKRYGALVSSCVGGGSLIYANVLLRKDERWFVTEEPGRPGYERWPVTRADLDPHYDEVLRQLDAQVYPQVAPYTATEKVNAFRAAVRRLADRDRAITLEAPPLAVTFAAGGGPPLPGAPIDLPNMYGVARRTCVLCGECIVGCNHGSKNTLDLTYLSRATAKGADLRPLSEVRTLRRLAGGGPRFEVTYVVHDPARGPGPTTDLPTRTVTCDRLIVAAGALGSTYLLLRNRAALGLDSPHLGTRFSGNGDLLSFALACRDEGKRPYRVDPTHGPAITSALRHADALDGAGAHGRGFYVQDAGFPTHLAWLAEGMNPVGFLARGLTLVRRMLRKLFGGDDDPDLSREISDVFGSGDLAATMLPLLGMGRDVPDGTLGLRKDRYLELHWSRARSADFFDRLEATSRQLAEELGGTFVLNPTSKLFKRLITVHPLGGAPMGERADGGVVDSFGAAFGCDGLHVLDGSILPGPVGPNPALTIAAVADRAMTRLLAG